MKFLPLPAAHFMCEVIPANRNSVTFLGVSTRSFLVVQCLKSHYFAHGKYTIENVRTVKRSDEKIWGKFDVLKFLVIKLVVKNFFEETSL